MTKRLSRTRRALAALALLGLAGPAMTQGRPPVTLDPFIDRQSSTVHISGRSIVGASVGGAPAAALTTTPEVYVARTRADDRPDICVETTAIDGTYWSRGQLRGDDVRAYQGVLQFRYGNDRVHENNFRAAAQKFGADGLAVLATLRACDGVGRGDQFVVVNRTGMQVAERIDIYVNTARADAELVYERKGGQPVVTPCVPVQGAFQRVAYDAICSVRGPFETEMSMRLVLSRFGEAQDPLGFSLMLALPAARP